MQYELQRIVAFVLKSQGIKEISESDFVNYLSVKKRMLMPADAKRILEMCIKNGIVVKDGDVLRPHFELDTVNIPPNYTINIENIESEKVDVFMDILRYISDKTGKDIKEISAGVNQTQEKTCTIPAVAALIYAKSLGVDVSNFYAIVEKDLYGRKDAK
jgi:hypothetical protein